MKRHRSDEKKNCLMKAKLFGAHEKNFVCFQLRLLQVVLPILPFPDTFWVVGFWLCLGFFFAIQSSFFTRAPFLVVFVFNLKLSSTLI